MKSNNLPTTTSKIIGASWVIPINNQFDDYLQDYAVLVEDTQISQIAPYRILCDQHPETPRQFLDQHILLPGLVNCHGHAAMSLLRGLADDLALSDWLENHIWPAEARLVNETFVALGSELAIAEMLLSGTTTFADMYFFPEQTAAVAEKTGIRAQLTFPVIEFANNWAVDADQHIAKGLDLLDNCKHNELITIGFGPHAPYSVDDKTFERVAMLANEVDAPIQLHLHETVKEVEDSIRTLGVRPIERLAKLGVFSPRTQVVHLTQFNSDDLDTLADNGCSVVHCPTSNMKLASGYCDISTLLEKGITVGLGTDSAASNNRLSTFDSVRTASLLAKHHISAASLDTKEALHAATLGGARTLGIDHITGNFEPGKQADMIAVSTQSVAMQPLHNPLSQLVYTDCSAAVEHVWVAGRHLVKNRELLSINQSLLLQQSRDWKLGLSSENDLPSNDTL